MIELSSRRLAAEHVGAKEAEGAVVGHQPEGHERADALADLVCVQAADRYHAPAAAEPVPLAHVALRRVLEHAARRDNEAQRLREALEGLGGIGHEAPELDAVERVGVERGERHAVTRALEAARAAREGVGRERETARRADCAQDAVGVELVVDLGVHAEGQAVVAPRGRDLLAHQQQHAVVPALVALPLGLERVVVGEHHHVHPGAAAGPHDLAHRAGAVRMERVQVDHAGQVVHRRNAIRAGGRR